MPDAPSPEQAPNTLGLLRELTKLRHQRVTSGPPDAHLLALREFQTARLARSYADLLAHPRFNPACRFFLDDIYAPRDFTQRDHDMRQMHDFMRRFVPAGMIHPLTLTVKLHALTEHLDTALVDALYNRLQLAGPVTLEAYAEAYRLCDNYAARVDQIEWVSEIGRDLDRIVRQPLTGTVLALAGAPARRAGWEELTGFLDRGYRAFKHLHGAKAFIDVVTRRERRFLDRIYAHDPDPYGFNAEAGAQPDIE
jgi:hypothetical protein